MGKIHKDIAMFMVEAAKNEEYNDQKLVKVTKRFHRIECFHSRDYRPYWFAETKESICIKIKFNSQRFSLGHQHGRHFFVLGHQHGRREVM